MTERSDSTTRRWLTERRTGPSMTQEVFDPQLVINGLVVRIQAP